MHTPFRRKGAGKLGWIGAGQAIEFGKKGLADAGLGRTRLKSLHGGVVQAGDLSGQQAFCVGAAQCCDSGGRMAWLTRVTGELWFSSGLHRFLAILGPPHSQT